MYYSNPAKPYLQSLAAAETATAKAGDSTATSSTTTAIAADSLIRSLSKSVTLKDGRKLSFHQYGNPNGTPIFFFHSAGSSRYEIDSLGV